MKKIIFGMSLMLILVALMADSCDTSGQPQGPGTPQQANQYCNPQTSLACKSVQQRYKLMSNANQYGYFYGFIMGSPEPLVVYITQGGVFPLDDQVSPPDYQEPCNSGGSGACSVVRQQQQPDGTWGTNGDGWFGFRADGQYFEWDGLPHAFSFQPLQFRPTYIVGCVSSLKIPLCQ